MLCPRGNAGIQALYDPDRLKTPLIRVGEKGEGKFKQVSWEEAYDAILKWDRLVYQELGKNLRLRRRITRQGFPIFVLGEGDGLENTF